MKKFFIILVIFAGIFSYIKFMHPIKFNYIKYYLLLPGEKAPRELKEQTNHETVNAFAANPNFSWMHRQIKSDLQSFKNISSKELDLAYKKYQSKNNRLARIKIFKGKLYLHRDIEHICRGGFRFENHTRVTLNFLKLMSEKGLLPDVDFIINLNDYVIDHPTPLPQKKPPIFTFARDNKQVKERDFILIPDWHHFGFSYTHGLTTFKKLAPVSEFDQKKDIILFRGGDMDCSGYRSKVVAYAKDKSFIDAQRTEGQENLKYFMSHADQLKYKYQLSIDGATATWTRVTWILASNSALLKQDSQKVQWFYEALMPYKHFIPVSNDPKDLEKTFKWLQANPEKVKEVIKNGQEFYKQNLSYKAIVAYVYLLLHTYKKHMAPGPITVDENYALYGII